MKETNMEHYRGEIGEIIEECIDVNPKIAIVDGKPVPCKRLAECNKCELKEGHSCFLDFIEWLMSEYKEEPVLTEREKHFVELVREGWIARDLKYNCFYWFKEKPTKGNDAWYCECSTWLLHSTLLEGLFPFITWEDEEPWSIERLRELKVQDAD